jgi:hypothetical protein
MKEKDPYTLRSEKQDISILVRIGHFYFGLTTRAIYLLAKVEKCIV